MTLDHVPAPRTPQRRQARALAEVAYHAAVSADMIHQTALMIERQLDAIAAQVHPDGTPAGAPAALITLDTMRAELERTAIRLAAVEGRMGYSARRLVP